jgi:phosphoglycolate phosphatase-like HAD superfamily hydrolase
MERKERRREHAPFKKLRYWSVYFIGNEARYAGSMSQLLSDKPFFNMASGLDDHYANSKLDSGRAMIRKQNLEPKELLLIGDTVYDFEVVSQLGCSCILVSNGHQS